MEQTENLKELVRDEAAKLREFATVEERGRLDFSRLKPGDLWLCIYGQMTGSCFSERSLQLLQICSIPYGYNLIVYEYHKRGFDDTFFRSYSPIDFYTCQPYAKNAELISYLKGETDILEL